MTIILCRYTGVFGRRKAALKYVISRKFQNLNTFSTSTSSWIRSYFKWSFRNLTKNNFVLMFSFKPVKLCVGLNVLKILYDLVEHLFLKAYTISLKYFMIHKNTLLGLLVQVIVKKTTIRVYSHLNLIHCICSVKICCYPRKSRCFLYMTYLFKWSAK